MNLEGSTIDMDMTESEDMQEEGSAKSRAWLLSLLSFWLGSTPSLDPKKNLRIFIRFYKHGLCVIAGDPTMSLPKES